MKINVVNPDISKLGYITAVANLGDKHDRSTPTHYHWKILKCRMIIFSNSSILACPDKKDLKQVHIIFNKSGDDYDKLNLLFMKYSLVQDGGINTVTPEIFQMCFHYTMTARIAPVWNTLGDNYLINNRDFLTTKGPQEGVKYNISVNEINTVMEIFPVKINLMISDEEFLSGEWIRVLPSLNKAIIEDSHNVLTEIAKFKSYKDLRRHWKNIHGYRLPEEESSYYSIQFWRGEPLLYPKECVIRNFPIITPVPKPIEKTIFTRFLNCLKSKMSNVLGGPLIIQIQNAQIANDIPQNLNSLTKPKAIIRTYFDFYDEPRNLRYGSEIPMGERSFIRNIEFHNFLKVMPRGLTQTQAVSLCTPTQFSRRLI